MNDLHKIEAFIILDYSGKRVFAKYFQTPFEQVQQQQEKESKTSSSSSTSAVKLPFATIQSQLDFEKLIKSKVVTPDGDGPITTAEGDIMLCEGHIVVFHRDAELLFFTVGPSYENELVLSTVQATIIDSLSQLLNIQNAFDKRNLLENFFILALVLDEVIDDGMVLEVSVSNVVQEVAPYAQPDNQAADGAKKALKSLNKYLKQNL